MALVNEGNNLLVYKCVTKPLPFPNMGSFIKERGKGGQLMEGEQAKEPGWAGPDGSCALHWAGRQDRGSRAVINGAV